MKCSCPHSTTYTEPFFDPSYLDALIGRIVEYLVSLSTNELCILPTFGIVADLLEVKSL